MKDFVSFGLQTVVYDIFLKRVCTCVNVIHIQTFWNSTDTEENCIIQIPVSESFSFIKETKTPGPNHITGKFLKSCAKQLSVIFRILSFFKTTEGTQNLEGIYGSSNKSHIAKVFKLSPPPVVLSCW